jgi:hypothetical protein
MATIVKVDSTCDRPLSTRTFHWLRVLGSHNWWMQVPPPIPHTPEDGYVGSKGPVMQRESRPAKGRLLMLGIGPPLDSAPDLKAKHVLRLQEASQLVSDEYGGEVAEIWRDIDGEGSKCRKIRLPSERWNHLGRGAAYPGRKQERHGGPQESAPAKVVRSHHVSTRSGSPGRRTAAGLIAAFPNPKPSSQAMPCSTR